MKVEKWTRSRLNRFLPILRQLQDEDFQSELTELFEKSSSAKVIKFLEEIIPKGFIEDIFPKIYKDESINILIQFADINLEFVIQKIISSSDKVIVNTYFSKLGHNPGKIELDDFLGLFFLPIITDWSPSTTVAESEFLNVLTKLNNFEELKKKFDEMELTELTHNQVVDFFTETIPEMEQSNLNFVLSANCLLCPKNCLVWYGSENPDDVLIITLTCEHPELKNQDIFKMQFHVSKKDGNGFCELHLTSNTIPSLLEAATIAYQFS